MMDLYPAGMAMILTAVPVYLVLIQWKGRQTS